MVTVLIDILMLPLVLVKYMLQYRLGLRFHRTSAPEHCYADVNPAVNTDAQAFSILIVAVDLQTHIF